MGKNCDDELELKTKTMLATKWVRAKKRDNFNYFRNTRFCPICAHFIAHVFMFITHEIATTFRKNKGIQSTTVMKLSSILVLNMSIRCEFSRFDWYARVMLSYFGYYETAEHRCRRPLSQIVGKMKGVNNHRALA